MSLGPVGATWLRARQLGVPLSLGEYLANGGRRNVGGPVQERTVAFGTADGKPLELDVWQTGQPASGPLRPDAPATDQLIAAGWGYASFSPSSVQADNGAGLTKGIIVIVNNGQPRKPDDWGSLRAWAWGAAGVLDYFETDKAVDAKRVGI